MNRAIEAWLDEVDLPASISTSQLTLSYTVYGCMLLLPTNAFQDPAWQDMLSQRSDDELERLYAFIAHHLKVTHIASNRPIPALNNTNRTENILRAPNNFTPLHGDFGPSTCFEPPTAEDFDAAFWVTAKQNGICQSWAPRWTMFSRGNISEKARLLTLPSVVSAIEQGKANGIGSTAVDLYAGIGYFAFSYIKAGIDRVLCWDLNPWSIEGLRRGAAANKWPTAIYSESDTTLLNMADSKAKLLVFNESNEHAVRRIQRLQHHLPPTRHVNCGLLPSSRGSWETAVSIMNWQMGGWVHVHENFAVKEIEQKAEEVRTAFQVLLNEKQHGGTATIEHINRLKSYAPGVMHCVVDIYISPYTPG